MNPRELGFPLQAGRPPIARPEDERGIRSVLEHARRENLRVAPIGGGRHLSVCRPDVERGEVDLLLSTAALDRVVEYVPGDGTLTAQAGCSMQALAETVAEGGHALTPRVPNPERASLGGTLGAGRSGLDRVRYGPLRHHVLGMRVMLADGSVARSGGRLVKNVTGFDLHRLYTGSRGTLCVILEASLRLFPLPEAERHLVWKETRLEPQLERAAALADSALEPRVEALLREEGIWELHLGLAGLGVSVAFERDLAVQLAGSPTQELEGEHPELFDIEESGGGTQIESCAPPGELAARTSELDALGAERILILPRVGRLCAWIQEPSPLPPPQIVDLWPRFIPRALPFAWHEALAPRATEVPALAPMLSLQKALDPEGRFASNIFPGRP